MVKTLRERMEYIKLFWDWCGEISEGMNNLPLSKQDARYSNQCFILFNAIDTVESFVNVLIGDITRKEFIEVLESIINEDLKKEFNNKV